MIKITAKCIGIGEYVDGMLFNSSIHVNSLSYLDDPLFPSDDVGFNQHANYTITRNAMLLNVASPEAITEAVMFLIEHEDIRFTIAKNGRDTIESYFHVQRQMMEYEQFYDHLVSTKRMSVPT
jgi:hypothetical protein